MGVIRWLDGYMFGWLTESSSPSPRPSSTEDSSSGAVSEAADKTFGDLFTPEWWLSDFLPAALRIALIMVVGFVIRHLVIRVINRTVRRMARKSEKKIDVLGSDQAEREIDVKREMLRADTVGKLLSNVTTIIVLTFVGLLILAELGFDLGPLLAGAGFIGVALGFGAQSLVADFMNGIFMMMEDQFGVGDIVRVTGPTGTDATGTVEKVSLRITQIRSVDGTLWSVRNGQINSSGNMSQDWSRGVLDVGISYESDIKQAKEILASVGEEFAHDQEFGELVLKTPEVWGVQELGSDAVILRMVIKTRPGDHWMVSRQLLERIKYAFDAAGIEIPFPQRTVWLRNSDSEPAPSKGQRSSEDIDGQ